MWWSAPPIFQPLVPALAEEKRRPQGRLFGNKPLKYHATWVGWRGWFLVSANPTCTILGISLLFSSHHRSRTTATGTDPRRGRNKDRWAACHFLPPGTCRLQLLLLPLFLLTYLHTYPVISPSPQPQILPFGLFPSRPGTEPPIYRARSRPFLCLPAYQSRSETRLAGPLHDGCCIVSQLPRRHTAEVPTSAFLIIFQASCGAAPEEGQTK